VAFSEEIMWIDVVICWKKQN